MTWPRHYDDKSRCVLWAVLMMRRWRSRRYVGNMAATCARGCDGGLHRSVRGGEGDFE